MSSYVIATMVFFGLSLFIALLNILIHDHVKPPTRIERVSDAVMCAAFLLCGTRLIWGGSVALNALAVCACVLLGLASLYNLAHFGFVRRFYVRVFVGLLLVLMPLVHLVLRMFMDTGLTFWRGLAQDYQDVFKYFKAGTL